MEDKNRINFYQINLQHAKVSSLNLTQNLSNIHQYVVLIQEPWVNNNSICGLGTDGNLYRPIQKDISPRSCILTSKNIQGWLLTELTDRDQVTVQLTLNIKNSPQKLIISSIYMPHDQEIPSQLLLNLNDHSYTNNKPLIIGSDVNAHHIVWGSTNINNRGEDLYDFIMTSNLIILNKDNTPTFRDFRREEVLDITLVNKAAEKYINNWEVSQDLTFSDHNMITFDIKSIIIKCKPRRIPQKTDWSNYTKTVQNLIINKNFQLSNIKEIEDCSNYLIKSLQKSYSEHTPLIYPKKSKNKRWWNQELAQLRKQARQKSRRAFTTKNNNDIEIAKESQRTYKREVVQLNPGDISQEEYKSILSTEDQSNIDENKEDSNYVTSDGKIAFRKPTTSKRKIEMNSSSKKKSSEEGEQKKIKKSEKEKKSNKKLLSFDDDDEL